jgi:hypothetical protein
MSLRQLLKLQNGSNKVAKQIKAGKTKMTNDITLCKSMTWQSVKLIWKNGDRIRYCKEFSKENRRSLHRTRTETQKGIIMNLSNRISIENCFG